jgi:5-methylcytosine-specific restriction protein A
MRSVPEWIGKNDDTAAPDRVKDRVRERDKWVCQGCKRQLREGDKGEVDHAIAICNGGPNREQNLWLLCDWCHDEKTKLDVAAKSKSYRIRRRRAGIKSRHPIQGWRKFDGSPVRNPKLIVK